MIVSEEDEIAWLFNLRGEGETTNKVGTHFMRLKCTYHNY